MVKKVNQIALRELHSYTLKELSSPIFQSLSASEYGMDDTCPDLHFVQYVKPQTPSTDPILSIANCNRLIVFYTDPVHMCTASSSRNTQLSQLDLVSSYLQIDIEYGNLDKEGWYWY